MRGHGSGRERGVRFTEGLLPLLEGDVIVGVNQVAIAGASAARAAIEQAEKAGRKSVFLEVSRHGEENFLAVPFGKA